MVSNSRKAAHITALNVDPAYPTQANDSETRRLATGFVWELVLRLAGLTECHRSFCLGPVKTWPKETK